MKTMKNKLRYSYVGTLVFILLLFLICTPNTHSLEISGIEAQAFYRGEYTRGNDFLNELSAIGTLGLGEILTFKGGFAVGRTIVDTEISTLLSTIYTPFSAIPLGFSVSYIYNGLPEYEAHAHSIVPLVSFNGRIAGVSLGVNFRFTEFFGDTAQIESFLTFYGYANFVNTEVLTIGVGAGNFRDFQSKNLGAFSLDFNASIKIFDNWTLMNQVEWMQSGADGLTTTLYGIAFRTGVKYSW